MAETIMPAYSEQGDLNVKFGNLVQLIGPVPSGSTLQGEIDTNATAIANVSNLVFPASVGTEITSAIDFNTFVSPGVRTFSSNTTIANSTNKPCSYAGRLVVWTINGSNLNTRYGLGGQIYIDFSGNQYVRSATADSSGIITWGSWDSYALNSNLVTKTTTTADTSPVNITSKTSNVVTASNFISALCLSTANVICLPYVTSGYLYCKLVDNNLQPVTSSVTLVVYYKGG